MGEVSLAASARAVGPDVELRIVDGRGITTQAEVEAAKAISSIKMTPEMGIHLAGQIINASRKAANWKDD